MAQHVRNTNRLTPLKLIVVGDSSVGKTSLIQMFANNQFSNSVVSTVGIDFLTKRYEVDGTTYKVQIWDTAGQEKFRTIITSYYRGVQGAVLIYDVTNKSTFDAINYWVKNVQEFGEQVIGRILVGNKTDLEQHRTVSTEMGQSLADKIGIPFIETSAAKGENIQETFTCLIKEVIENQKQQTSTKSTERVNVTKPTTPSTQEQAGCC
ncbi:Rab family GTPase [Entamoeba histolytica HM-1:IMSS-B]|uniref:Rab family GTPase n=6 Tax=Entamoeba histolytica TaxID=5759 RepID=A0A8U0WP79_ENTH1|eukprot:XP_653656.1 Rab family GTPase [Entamoeba histolytica HM-1:IMSS]